MHDELHRAGDHRRKPAKVIWAEEHMNHTAAKRAFPRRGQQNFSGIKKFGAHSEPNSDAAKSTGERSHKDVVEAMASLFEPDILAAAQYFDNFRRKTLIEPEKRLLPVLISTSTRRQSGWRSWRMPLTAFTTISRLRAVNGRSSSTMLKNGFWRSTPTGYSLFAMSVSFWG